MEAIHFLFDLFAYNSQKLTGQHSVFYYDDEDEIRM